MPDQPEPACLVLADISGYTSYLAGVELDHAQDILADLTDAVVRALRPTFRLAKLEGDAAFAYVVTDVIDGSILQDTIEHCYIAFRRRLRDIGQASQCDCNACTYIPRLDLKFVVHHGLIARQRMAGREELVGRDVIVVHRLLKNDVQAALGIGAYALYTDDCVRMMGLADPAGAGLVEHRETYDFVGEVSGWVRDLEAVWQEAEAEFGVGRRGCAGGLDDVVHLRRPAGDRLGVDHVAGPPTPVADRRRRRQRGRRRWAARRRHDEPLRPWPRRDRRGGPRLASTGGPHDPVPDADAGRPEVDAERTLRGDARRGQDVVHRPRSTTIVGQGPRQARGDGDRSSSMPTATAWRCWHR